MRHANQPASLRAVATVSTYVTRKTLTGGSGGHA